MSKESILKSVQESVINDIRKRTLSEMPLPDRFMAKRQGPKQPQISGPVDVYLVSEGQAAMDRIHLRQFRNVQDAIQACIAIDKITGITHETQDGPYCVVVDSSGKEYGHAFGRLVDMDRGF